MLFVRKSLSDILYEIKDHISLCGRLGCIFADILDVYKLSHDVGQVIAIRLQLQGFIFQKCNESEEEINVAAAHRLFDTTTLVIAPQKYTYLAFGIRVPEDIPNSDQCLIVLEYLGAARERGCLTNDLVSKLACKAGAIHTVLDRLVTLELVIKRIVVIPSVRKAIFLTKTNIIHLKRFAPFFDPATYGYSFAPDDSVKIHVSNIMAEHLIKMKRPVISCSEIAKIMNIGYRNMHSFRLGLAQSANSYKVRFFYSQNGEMCEETPESHNSQSKCWYVRLNENYRAQSRPGEREDGDGEEDNAEEEEEATQEGVGTTGSTDQSIIGWGCLLDLPFHHQCIHLLEKRGTRGITTVTITSATGSGSKRTHRVALELIDKYKVPCVKQREGRQRIYRMYAIPRITSETMTGISSGNEGSNDVAGNDPNISFASPVMASTEADNKYLITPQNVPEEVVDGCDDQPLKIARLSPEETSGFEPKLAEQESPLNTIVSSSTSTEANCPVILSTSENAETGVNNLDDMAPKCMHSEDMHTVAIASSDTVRARKSKSKCMADLVKPPEPLDRQQTVLNVLTLWGGISSFADIHTSLEASEVSDLSHRLDRKTTHRVIEKLVDRGLVRRSTVALPNGLTTSTGLTSANLVSLTESLSADGDRVMLEESVLVRKWVEALAASKKNRQSKIKQEVDVNEQGSPVARMPHQPKPKPAKKAPDLPFVLHCMMEPRTSSKNVKFSGGRVRGSLKGVVDRKLASAFDVHIVLALLCIVPHGLVMAARELHGTLCLIHLAEHAASLSPTSLSRAVMKAKLPVVLKIAGLPPNFSQRLSAIINGTSEAISPVDRLIIEAFHDENSTLESVAEAVLRARMTSTSAEQMTTEGEEVVMGVFSDPLNTKQPSLIAADAFEELKSAAMEAFQRPMAVLVSLGIVQPQQNYMGRAVDSNFHLFLVDDSGSDDLTLQLSAERLREKSEIIKQSLSNALAVRHLARDFAVPLFGSDEVRQETAAYEAENLFTSVAFEQLELVWMPPSSRCAVYSEGDVLHYWCTVVVALQAGVPLPLQSQVVTEVVEEEGESSDGEEESLEEKEEEEPQQPRRRKPKRRLSDLPVPLMLQALAAPYAGRLVPNDFSVAWVDSQRIDAYDLRSSITSFPRFKDEDFVQMEEEVPPSPVTCENNDVQQPQSEAPAEDVSEAEEEDALVVDPAAALADLWTVEQDATLLGLFLRQVMSRITPFAQNADAKVKTLGVDFPGLDTTFPRPFLYTDLQLLELHFDLAVGMTNAAKNFWGKGGRGDSARTRLMSLLRLYPTTRAVLGFLHATGQLTRVTKLYPILSVLIARYILPGTGQLQATLAASRTLLDQQALTALILAYAGPKSTRDGRLNKLRLFPSKTVRQVHRELVMNRWMARTVKSSDHLKSALNLKEYQFSYRGWTRHLKATLAPFEDILESSRSTSSGCGSGAIYLRPPSSTSMFFQRYYCFIDGSVSSNVPPADFTYTEDVNGGGCADTLYLAHALAGDRLLTNLTVEAGADKVAASATAEANDVSEREEESSAAIGGLSPVQGESNSSAACAADGAEVPMRQYWVKRLSWQAGHLSRGLNRLRGDVLTTLGTGADERDVVVGEGESLKAAAVEGESEEEDGEEDRDGSAAGSVRGDEEADEAETAVGGDKVSGEQPMDVFDGESEATSDKPLVDKCILKLLATRGPVGASLSEVIASVGAVAGCDSDETVRAIRDLVQSGSVLHVVHDGDLREEWCPTSVARSESRNDLSSGILFSKKYAKLFDSDICWAEHDRLFRVLVGRVTTLLAVRPGATFAMLRNSVPILTARQAVRFLETLEREGVVRRETVPSLQGLDSLFAYDSLTALKIHMLQSPQNTSSDAHTTTHFFLSRSLWMTVI